jgi:hypothetical protein
VLPLKSRSGEPGRILAFQGCHLNHSSKKVPPKLLGSANLIKVKNRTSSVAIIQRDVGGTESWRWRAPLRERCWRNRSAHTPWLFKMPRRLGAKRRDVIKATQRAPR